MGSGFDLGFNSMADDLRQRRDIAERQRVQQQNTVGAQLLDAINNAGDIKPQTKDENGNIIHNPEYDTAQQNKTKLLQQYTQLNSPEQHASFAQHLHGLIFGHPTPHTQQPALSPNSSPVPPAPDPNAAPASAPPAPVEQPHPMGAAAPNHPLHAITGGIKALGDAIKNHAGAFANPLPAQNAPDPALMAKYYRDPAEVQAERAQALATTHGQFQVEAAKARGANVRPFHVGDANTEDAIAKLKLMPGIEYQDEQGNPITEAMLSEAPQYMKLAEFRQGPNTFYKLIDQRSKETNIGGVKYQVNELGAIKPADSTALGQAATDKDTTHQVPGMNPGEVVTLHGTQAPVRPGMTPAPPSAVAPPTSGVPDSGQAAPVEPPAPTLKARPVSTKVPTLPPSPSQAALAAKTNAGRSQSKQIPIPSGAPMPPPFAPGTMLSQGRAAQPVVGAMSVVAANVFGGNGEKPLWDNAWMYDNPQIRKALNNALTLNALANPGTEDNPTLMQTLATAVGATQWSQEQINDANVQARQELQRLGGPEALKQFAREAALQEDLSALRTATKASAAQGSIRTLVRAAPVYNISSSQDFRNQLGTTLGTAAASMRGYPAINPKYVDWWDRGVSAAKGGPVSNNAPKTPGAANSQVYEMGGKRFTYNGSGKKSDMANYTEVPSGR